MILRHPTPSDAGPITKLHIHTWRIAYGPLVPAGTFDRLDPEPHLKRWTDRCRDEPENVVVCEETGRIVGFALLGAVRDTDLDRKHTIELYALYVDPDFWRKGIGRRLAEAAERLAVDRGFRTIVLWALKDNQRARLAYQRMGFALDPEQEKDAKFFGLNLREIRFTRALR
ncbi:MAG: GNAT family N-acetyltransferase [Planctomycetota bacterium]